MWTMARSWLIRSSSDGAQRTVSFGLAGDIAQPGDYDGDGRADLAVGIPREDNASVEEGAVYVLPGSRTLVALDRDRLLRGASRLLTRAQERGAHFGWSMAGRMPASSTTRIANPKV